MLPRPLWGSNKRNAKERANKSHATIGFYTQKDSHALARPTTCLMGEAQDDNVKTVVRASTCSMGEENANTENKILHPPLRKPIRGYFDKQPVIIYELLVL